MADPDPDRPLCAVMVCAHGGCAHAADANLEALKPLVARSERAVLIRTGCLDPHHTCPPRRDSASVRLQRCTSALRPLGPSTSMCERTVPTYRRVEQWLDRQDSQEPERQ